MNNEAIMIIIRCLVIILLTVVSSYVVPWLKSKVDADKLATIEDFAIIFVRSAEQLYSPEKWAEKKDYAMNSLIGKAKEIGINISLEELNAIVESAVNYIKYGSEYNK